MGSQTTGNIGTLNWTIGTSVDESSLQASISRMGQALRDADKGMDMKALAKKSAVYEPPTDVIGRLSEFTRSQEAASQAELANRNANMSAARLQWDEQNNQIRRAAAGIKNQHDAEMRYHAEESAAAQRENSQWLAFQAAREKAGQTIATVRQQQYEAEATTRAAAENKAQQTIATVRKQQMQALRRQERENIADAQTGVTILQRVQQTAHDRRMRQLLTEDGTIRNGSAAQAAAQKVNDSSNLAGRSGKIGGRIQEFGRGFEDFAIGFSMAKTNVEGIAMGLRGSANNAAQLAASFNPMVGAAVAIGASLTAVILPGLLRWLFENKQLEESTKRLEEAIKLAGKAELQAAKDIAKFRVELRKDEKNNIEDKGKDVVKQLEDQKNKRLDLAVEASEQVKQLNKADAAFLAAEEKEKASKAKMEVLGAKLAAEGIFGSRRLVLGNTEEENQTVATAAADKRNREMAEARRKTIKDGLVDTERDMLSAQQSEADIRLRFADEIAKAETDVKLEADRKFAEEENKILVAADKERNKQKEDEEKAIRDKIKEQLKVDDDLATAKLDAKIAANSEQQDALQERMQKSGNAAGPSAALVIGTQSAEQAINRALSGSQSVENTMKAQLAELKNVNKNLQKTKQLKVASI